MVFVYGLWIRGQCLNFFWNNQSLWSFFPVFVYQGSFRKASRINHVLDKLRKKWNQNESVNNFTENMKVWKYFKFQQGYTPGCRNNFLDPAIYEVLDSSSCVSSGMPSWSQWTEWGLCEEKTRTKTRECVGANVGDFGCHESRNSR